MSLPQCRAWHRPMNPPKQGFQFTEIQPASRSAQVREQLQAAIENGQYAPGDRLPSERELGRVLGVSRVSIREAIRSLEAIGLVEVQHGRGSFVTDGSSVRADAARELLARHRDEVFELLRVRGALDALAAGLAAEAAKTEDLARLRSAHEGFVHALEGASSAELARLDVAFHTAVGEAAGSHLLADLLRDLHQHLAWSRDASFEPRGRARQSAREHEAIVDAIEAGDATRARAAVDRHVGNVKRVLAKASGAS